MPSSLSISRLISVLINLAPTPAQIQNLNNLLFLGSSDVINTFERLRNYTSLPGVATDFGTAAPEYLAAALWFEQAPQPSTLSIGRWAKTATSGKLVCASLSATQQLLATWTAVITPTFEVSLDGIAYPIAPASFATALSMNGVAALIQTALNVAVAGTTCVWNSAYSRFEIEAAGSTGIASTVSFLTPTGAGTDISGMMAGLVGSAGAYTVAGIVAETALTAVTLFDQQFGQTWYGLSIAGAVDADHVAVAGYIEGASTKHFYGITSQEPLILTAGDTTNIAYQLQQLKYNHSAVQYSSSNPYAVVSALARILTTDYNANNSVITLDYKQEPGIVPETLNATQITNLEAYDCNVFLSYNNNTAIFEPGICPSGNYMDTVMGVDWLSLDIQTALYNILYGSTTKIPQTDGGNHKLVNGIESVCSQGVTNGLLAPGTWDVGGFGSLNQGDFLSKGFYVYAPPIASQNAADRAARKSVPIQVAAKLAGAIQTINVIINVNR